jgi:hypothetical protein
MKTCIKFVLASLSVVFSSCAGPSPRADLINTKASLPSSFNFSKLGLNVMSTFINKKRGTMSTLYGNPMALNASRAGGDKLYGGEVFALITWQQQEDVNWFGAKIPGQLQSVEMVNIAGEDEERIRINYALYKGRELTRDPDTLNRRERINYILNQKPSVMP